jgi:hypothetical protein
MDLDIGAGQTDEVLDDLLGDPASIPTQSRGIEGD